jgi:saccharopine dehydrogenase-like NADP-dependent oxidoreductase
MLAYYPNRDSLKYLETYDIPDIKTFMRATLRYPAFCKGWNAAIALGLTAQDDAFDTQGHTLASWLMKKTNIESVGALNSGIAEKLGVEKEDKVMNMLQWLGIFDETPLSSGQLSSAEILLEVLLKKWEMKPDDKDMVVMQHDFEYLHKNQKTRLNSTMVIKGDNRELSAMAKTVGLPMGILAKLVLQKKVAILPGVHIPNMPSVYRPVLTELAKYGIVFNEVVE